MERTATTSATQTCPSAYQQRIGKGRSRASTIKKKLRKPPSRNYAPRRVPQTFSPGYLRRRLLPLVPLGLVASATTAAASLPVGHMRRQQLLRSADRLSTKLSEHSQRLYFDNPGLDTLTVRAIATHARRLAMSGKLYLRLRVALGMDADGRAQAMLPLVPTRGYDAWMVSMLVVGTAMGYFKGGPVHAALTYDSADTKRATPTPSATRKAQPRRKNAPQSLTDMAADIDDMYWVRVHGQPIKITAVGQAPQRRWLVSIPGTNNTSPESTANPADTEANIREVLNLPSAMRVGVVNALHDAMRKEGVEDFLAEPVFMCGHSQGGMVATALASESLEDACVNVAAVMSLGTPSRRMRIRPEVQMLAVAHDQDIVPSIDGTADHPADHRVTVRRRLNRPRKGPLYYAHASMTYTETVRMLERRSSIAPWGKIPETVRKLGSYLPKQGEQCRVFIYDIWQEILEPTTERTWDTVMSLGGRTWQPVEYNNQWEPQLPPLPSFSDVKNWWQA